MHLSSIATKALPLLLWASASSADATIGCYNYQVEQHDPFGCINDMLCTMRSDMVENHVWWPNGFSVYWSWSCNGNPEGCTNSYGGYVYAKNNHQDVQNAWDGLAAIINTCEGTPEGPGVSDAYPGGQYDWGYARYITEWWNPDNSCCNCSKRRTVTDGKTGIESLRSIVQARNHTLVPGQTYEHKVRLSNGTISTVERFTVSEDGSTKDTL